MFKTGKRQVYDFAADTREALDNSLEVIASQFRTTVARHMKACLLAKEE